MRFFCIHEVLQFSTGSSGSIGSFATRAANQEPVDSEEPVNSEEPRDRRRTSRMHEELFRFLNHRHEAHRNRVQDLRAARRAAKNLKLLDRRAHRDGHQAADAQLLDECWRDGVGRSRHDDPIERRMLRPPKIASLASARRARGQFRSCTRAEPTRPGSQPDNRSRSRSRGRDARVTARAPAS